MLLYLFIQLFAAFCGDIVVVIFMSDMRFYLCHLQIKESVRLHKKHKTFEASECWLRRKLSSTLKKILVARFCIDSRR